MRALVEPRQDVLALVVEATRLGEEERREIMMHLRECLAEPQGRRWRRIYAALELHSAVLMEELLKDGAPELVVETAEGRYFDLVQRLSLLEKFECTNDLRVQNMVRTKATGLRSEVVPRLETAGDAHASHASHKPATSSHVEAGSTGGSGGSTGGSTALLSEFFKAGDEKALELLPARCRTLAVGEGDFAFSEALATSRACRARGLVVTCLEAEAECIEQYAGVQQRLQQLKELGVQVICGVDATQLGAGPLKGTEAFERIVFNFPLLPMKVHKPRASNNDVQIANRAMLVEFLRSAASFLRPVLDGEVTSRLVTAPAKWAIRSSPFSW
eukprot:g33266.t1